MSVTLARVINEQTLPSGISRDGSILLDKIDRCQGNSSSPPYAQIFKQKLYVPKYNPADLNVKGYVDLVQTDEVKLQLELKGSIGGLANTIPPRVSISLINSSLIAPPTLTTAVNAVGVSTLTGTKFVPVAPDLTYVYLVNPSGVTQTLVEANFTFHNGTTITFVDGVVTGGPPGVGWTAQVFNNSQLTVVVAF